METFVDWLINGSPTWEAYYEFMSGRLIALDKQPVMTQVGAGETWRNRFDKIVLKVTVLEATMTCQDEHLCSRLKAGIDNAVRGSSYLGRKFDYGGLGILSRRLKERIQ